MAQVMREGSNRTSYHRISDGVEEHISVPDHDVAWHAGARVRPEFTEASGLDGYAVNEESLGLCFTLACPVPVAVATVARFCREYELTESAVWAHRESAFSRTDPRIIRDMSAFRAAVGQAI